LDKRHQIIVNILVSLAIFVLVFYLAGFDKIIGVILNANPLFLAFALIAYTTLTFVMAYRITVVLKSMGEHLPLRKAAPSNLAGLLASDFTPARVGYFFTAFSLSSRFKIATEKTIMAIFGPQLFDFLIKAVSAAILSAIIVARFGADGILINVILIAMVLCGIFFAGLLVFYPPFLGMLAFMEKLPLVSWAFGFLRRMHLHSDKILSVKWPVIGITGVTWVIKGLEWFFISRALGISVTGNPLTDLLFMMIFQAAITIIQFIPSPTVAGAGASEAAFAAVLFPFGVPVQNAVTFGFLTRMTMIVVDSFSLPVILEYLHKHSAEGTLDKLLRFEH